MPDSEKAMDVDEVPEEVLRFTIKDVYRQALIEGDVPEIGRASWRERVGTAV